MIYNIIFILCIFLVHSSSSANGFTNLASKRLTKQQIFPQIFENRKKSIAISQRKGTPHPKDDKDGKNEDSDSGRPHSTSENEGSLNGTYGRKHSMDYPFSNVKEETFEEEDDEYQEDEDEEEYSEKEEKDINESKIESDNESHISDDRDKGRFNTLILCIIFFTYIFRGRFKYSNR